jgi:hypothetical protein
MGHAASSLYAALFLKSAYREVSPGTETHIATGQEGIGERDAAEKLESAEIDNVQQSLRLWMFIGAHVPSKCVRAQADHEIIPSRVHQELIIPIIYIALILPTEVTV